MKKITAILLALTILAMSANVSALNVQNLEVKIDIDESGYANITENYVLGFISPFEQNDFEQSVKDNGSSVLAWKADYNFFYPHFGEVTGNRLLETGITFDNETKMLTLTYKLKDAFARLLKEEQRADTYTIDTKQFGAFITAGAIAIPADTTIGITVPQNSKIDPSKLPQNVSIIGNKITLSGIQSNTFTVEYSVFKPIIGNKETLEGISNIQVFGAIVILTMTVLYLGRNGFEKKVEDYIIKHSEIKKTDKEEDFELDMSEN